MIYAVAATVVPVDKLGTPSVRAHAVDLAIARLSRERAAIEGDELRSQPGRLGEPEIPDQSFGDLVIVMVEQGEGQRVRENLMTYFATPRT